jgi:hypothetical protein
MGLTLLIGLAVIVPVVLIIGWVASWRWAWWVRWGALAVVGIASVCCLAYGFLTPQAQLTPETCSWAPGCASWTPLYWMAAGLGGVGLVILLALAGLIAEVILRVKKSRDKVLRPRE